MADRNYRYEKYTDDDKIITCPIDDKDRTITGKYILNVIAYFDENPEERKRLGWIKHYYSDPSEIDYNPKSQFLVTSTEAIDEYTVKDVYNVLNKSEEQLAFEEMLSVASMDSPFLFL